ncbi:tRNA threonylcarbamoyladenosine dehydratase [Thermospira aquatica]|uniref:tRNA threonylcarbamoyladenosine dehydratase n=1 Tax=Thermospira aquatica TaxID=2828656 RepID=A0AAX3BFL7_9SPIR|nr:tRNA threonylcarbamoyladenosine dehydratase [Thermospira aquatica]URA10960.1 tRNA threonylcarbamoyladenosine dehydratase [Thermospira aquatica]
METLKENWLFRTESLIGAEGLHRLASLRVMACGVGGVGGMALEALARSGVGYFVVVDCDVFHPTNLNRQILATRESLGKPKTTIAKERILSINPEATVIPIQGFADSQIISILQSYPVDFVIDAIDSLNPKVQLISTLMHKNIPFISSMGAAARFDASSFRIGKLSDVKGCPLSRKVRQRLRRIGIDPRHIPVVYSTEMVKEGQGIASYIQEENFYERGRQRIPRGSLATTVMAAGLLCAQEVIMWALKKT